MNLLISVSHLKSIGLHPTSHCHMESSLLTDQTLRPHRITMSSYVSQGQKGPWSVKSSILNRLANLIYSFVWTAYTILNTSTLCLHPLCAFPTYKPLMFKMHSGSSLHSFVNLPLRMRTSAHNQLLISSFSQPNTLLYAGHTLFPQQPAVPPYLIWWRPWRRSPPNPCWAAVSAMKFFWSLQVARRTVSIPLLQPWHLLRALLLFVELRNKWKCWPHSCHISPFCFPH